GCDETHNRAARLHLRFDCDIAIAAGGIETLNRGPDVLQAERLIYFQCNDLAELGGIEWLLLGLEMDSGNALAFRLSRIAPRGAQRSPKCKNERNSTARGAHGVEGKCNSNTSVEEVRTGSEAVRPGARIGQQSGRGAAW